MFTIKNGFCQVKEDAANYSQISDGIEEKMLEALEEIQVNS